MSTVTQARLVGPSTLGTSSATLYTVPASTSVILKEILLVNTTTTAESVTLTIGGTTFFYVSVPGYAAGSTSNQVVVALSTVLNTSDVLAGLAGAASAVNITISGVTIA